MLLYPYLLLKFLEFDIKNSRRNSGRKSLLEAEIEEHTYDPTRDSMLKNGYVMLNSEDVKMVREYNKEYRRTHKVSPKIISELGKIGIGVDFNSDKWESFCVKDKIPTKLVSDHNGIRTYVKEKDCDEIIEFYMKRNF